MAHGGAVRRGAGAVDTAVAYLGFLLLCCLQSPGRIAPDTKLDLTADPVGFLARATHLWSAQSFGGQVQNQAYGYLFPQGPFFALFHVLGVPGWFAQRLWWALVLTVAFTGLVRLARALRVGTHRSRVVAGVLFALAPRMLADLGTISSEVWPVALAPWLMLPVVLALRGQMTPRRAGAGAALALALMGAVNAVATAAACAPAVLWWLLHRPNRTWARLAAWWLPLSAAVCVWWAVPLVLLGRVAPPFLDYIESASVTTRWASPAEVLRGASAWVPFVSPDQPAGARTATLAVFVLASALLAAAGLYGLLLRGMPARGRLLVIAAIGLVAMSAAWVGPVDGALAEPLRAFLDGPGAPLRNVHKAEPLLRLPLALGLAHLLARLAVRLPVAARSSRTTAAPARRERVLAVVGVLALAAGIALSPAWLGRIAPEGAYAGIPDEWSQAADWLAANAPAPSAFATGDSGDGGDAGAGGDGGAGGEDSAAPDPAATTRALVVPGSAFGRQLWGVTRDEPLQPLATTPWEVRDSIPLQPAPAIRALDAVQRRLADGDAAPGMAASLASLGVGYLVVRNDLAPDSGAPRPTLVHQSLAGSPGLVRVAAFGDPVGDGVRRAGDATVVDDQGLRAPYPPVEIYRVDSRLGSDGRLPGPPRTATAPYLVETRDLPVVAGGPESLDRLDDLAAIRGRAESPARVTRLLAADARAAGLDPLSDPLAGPRRIPDGTILTDTPKDRETDFGRMDHSSSAVRAPGDAPRGRGTTPDYAATAGDPADPDTADAARAQGRWTGARLTASSSASDSTRPGAVLTGSSPAAAVDGDPRTAWRSGGTGTAFGQWLQADLDAPADRLLLRVTVPKPQAGPAVSRIDVRTDAGTTTVHPTPGEQSVIPLPAGTTSSVRLTATGVEDGSRGSAFEISELSLRSGDRDLPLGHTVALPPAASASSSQATAEGAPAPAPAGWLLTQEFGGRAPCVGGGTRVEGLVGASEEAGAVRCAPGLGLEAEEPHRFARELDVPAGPATTVRPDLLVRAEPGRALDALLASAGDRSRQVRAEGASEVDDPRGSAAAAVDGDRSTSWYPDPAEPSPTLVVRLPQRGPVGSLRVFPPRAAVPSAPRVVTVDTGVERRRVDLERLPRDEDGSVTIPLSGAPTDRVTVRLDSGSDVRDSAGGVVTPGLAEVWAQDPAGARLGALPAAGSDTVSVGCADGPRVTIGDTVVRTRLTTTRRTLVEGGVVRVEPCGVATVSLRGPGPAAVRIDPGDAFTVDTLALPAVAAPASGSSRGSSGSTTAASSAARRAPALGAAEQPTRAVDTLRWDPDHRALRVPASPRSRVLVVPESVNPGWRATLRTDDGSPVEGVRAVTIDGWKQGWALPASSSATTLSLDYPSDVPYRLALASGPFALLLVLVLFLVPGRDRAGSRARPWAGLGAGGVAVTAVCLWLLAGWAGVGVTAAATVLGLVVSRRSGPARARRVLVGGAVGGVLAGAVLLARAPWPDPAGYAGDSLWPQLLTVSGLACAGVAAVWPAGERGGRSSSASRAGSSTQA